MEKYEWLWKTLKQHKQGIIDKFDTKERITPEQIYARMQHKTVLDIMEFLEIKEPQNNVEEGDK